MLELTINDTVYQFHFGMGFLRDINKKVSVTVNELGGVTKNVGLQYLVAGVADGEVESLVDLLDSANKGQTPRVTRDLLDRYVDDPNTDIDHLFSEVLDFLAQANATKKVVTAFLEKVKQQNLN